METLNKTCLQVPRTQTHQKMQGKPRPHMQCTFKEIDWLLREEEKIDAKFKPKQHLQSITGPDRTKLE